jgi:hypothetical protein
MGEFRRRAITRRDCGWSGRGADMQVGETFGDGADFHCPACGERYSFVQWSVTVTDDALADWPSKIPRVGD